MNVLHQVSLNPLHQVLFISVMYSFFESQEEKGINGAAIPVVLNPLPLFLTWLEDLASGVSTWHLKLNMPRVKQL